MADNSRFEQKALTRARAMAIGTLRRLGVDIIDGARTTTVEQHLTDRGMSRAPRESTTDYFVRFAEANRKSASREPWPFKKLKPAPHLRADEIDALPNQVSMGSSAQSMWWGE